MAGYRNSSCFNLGAVTTLSPSDNLRSMYNFSLCGGDSPPASRVENPRGGPSFPMYGPGWRLHCRLGLLMKRANCLGCFQLNRVSYINFLNREHLPYTSQGGNKSRPHNYNMHVTGCQQADTS